MRATAGRQGLTLLLLLLLASASAAETSRNDAPRPDPADWTTSDARWWPSLSFQGGIFHSVLQERIVSSDIVAPPVGNAQPIRPRVVGSSVYVSSWAAVAGELTGPELEVLPWAPRPFFHFDLGAQFGPRRDVAKERTVSKFRRPGPLSSIGTVDSFEASIEGQGSRLRTQTNPFFFGLGIGMSFEVTEGENPLRIRPSLEYLWEQVRAEGTVHRAVAQNASPSDGLTDFRLINMRATGTETFHGIGPGLEFEYDVSRRDNKVLSVFLGGRAYYLVGSRDYDFTATGPDADPGESAFFAVRRDPWNFRVGVGVRIRFEQ